jgi:cytochrome c-type biogenesis protein CcmH/NrfG
VVFAAVSVAAFLPDARLWGINHLAYYSPAVRIIALVLVAVSFMPAVARRLYGAALGWSRTIKDGGPSVDVAIKFIAVFSIVLFLGLKSSTNLLGDGQLVATNFRLAWEGDEGVVTRSAGAILSSDHIAPGATVLYYGAEKFVTGVLKRAPVFGIRFFNCMLGAAFLLIFLGLLRRSQLPNEIRLCLLVLTLFSSAVQLFFGYVENYTPLVFFLFLYVVSCLPVLHGRGRAWIPVVFFVLAVFVHVQAVLFLPSLIFLVISRLGQGRDQSIQRYAAPALVVLTFLGAIAVGLFTGAEKHYLPLTAVGETYGIISGAHLLDVLNELLLLMPILPVVLVMLWTGRSQVNKGMPKPEKQPARMGKKLKTKTPHTPATWFSLDSERRFFGLVVAACSIYLVLFKSDIGMGRDWDLFTMMCVGLVPLAVTAFRRFLKQAGDQKKAAFVVVPALMITMVMTSAWVGVNASSSRSVERFESMLVYDRTHAAYAHENLSIFYYSEENFEQAIKNMEAATEISKDPRQYVLLALYHKENAGAKAALQALRAALKIRPEYGPARLHLAAFLYDEGVVEELSQVARDGTTYFPGESLYWFYLGETLIQMGNTEEGLTALSKCKTLGPPPGLMTRINELISRSSNSKPE